MRRSSSPRGAALAGHRGVRWATPAVKPENARTAAADAPRAAAADGSHPEWPSGARPALLPADDPHEGLSREPPPWWDPLEGLDGEHAAVGVAGTVDAELGGLIDGGA